MKQLRIFIGGILGGIAIGIGGIVFLSIENKIIGAVMFSVGLYTICVHGLNLYTGKVGYLVENPVSYLGDIAVIWAGNFAGTFIAAECILATRVSGIAEKARAMCETKLADGPVSLFILGIFCGMLMYIAVEGYKKCANPLILYACVSCFILCGFEHCIADMFYFAAAGILSIKSLGCLIVITLGNSVGGVLIPLYKKLQASGKN